MHWKVERTELKWQTCLTLQNLASFHWPTVLMYNGHHRDKPQSSPLSPKVPRSKGVDVHSLYSLTFIPHLCVWKKVLSTVLKYPYHIEGWHSSAHACFLFYELQHSSFVLSVKVFSLPAHHILHWGLLNLHRPPPRGSCGNWAECRLPSPVASFRGATQWLTVSPRSCDSENQFSTPQADCYLSKSWIAKTNLRKSCSFHLQYKLSARSANGMNEMGEEVERDDKILPGYSMQVKMDFFLKNDIV